ncbi:MAG: response regulator [Acidobacteriota bacterium]
MNKELSVISKETPFVDKANILLVDDHPENLIALEAILESLGQNLVKAYSGAEALKHLLHQDFAVILLDVRMPVMDGFETAELIREREKSRHTPIIFLTALNKSDMHIFKGYSLGAVDYIVKPIVPEILRAKVGVFVDLFKKTQELIRQGEREAQANAIQQRLCFLAEASTLLSASLDYQITLANLARLIVPYLADWCTIDMIEDKQSIRRLAVAHVNPKMEELLREMWQRFPPDLKKPEPVFKALYDDKSELVPEIPDSLLLSIARDNEHLHMLYQLGSRSHMIVPLHARGRTIGAITFVSSESGRRYQHHDLTLAEDLAYRAAIAVDNARLYREAQEANRLKDHFLATVSHELRTPLNAILGWTRLLRSGKLIDTEATRALETIERNAKSQAQLIEDLLDISRIVTGKLHLDIRLVEPITIVKAAIDALRPAIDAKEIELQAALDPWINPISGDPNRLQQVIWNLLSNAIKFTPNGGKIEVRLERAGDYIEISVRDTGKGIKAEFLPYVFDRFRQADSTSTREHGGLGLGLAIVRHLVEMHGGSAYADSQGEGQGATFTVKFPLSPLPIETSITRDVDIPEACPSLEYQMMLEGLPILIVDDEQDTREMLVTTLRQCGAETKSAASAAEALKIIEHWKPAVIVSDIAMPGEDGYSLIRKLRTMETALGSRIPAIALTAYAKAEDRLRALSAGFQMHITKPIEPNELVTVIASLAELARKF